MTKYAAAVKAYEDAGEDSTPQRCGGVTVLVTHAILRLKGAYGRELHSSRNSMVVFHPNLGNIVELVNGVDSDEPPAKKQLMDAQDVYEPISLLAVMQSEK